MDNIIQTLNAQRADLLERLNRIDQMLEIAQNGGPQPGRKGLKPGKKKGGGKGKLKDAVVAELQAAGPAGISIKDIAARIGVPSSRLGTWFATTGKSTNAIKRLDRGVYTWTEGSAKEK